MSALQREKVSARMKKRPSARAGEEIDVWMQLCLRALNAENGIAHGHFEFHKEEVADAMDKKRGRASSLQS